LWRSGSEPDAFDDPALPGAVLLAQGVQRFRVLSVRRAGELDDEGQADLPEVREMKKTEYLVMLRREWKSLLICGGTVPLEAPADGPCAFVAIFRTKKQALAAAHGKSELVKAITTETP